jgi:anaerobic selenocysteine-containing dehydrogenase
MARILPDPPAITIAGPLLAGRGNASMDVRTSCTRDCPDACGLIATVENGRIVRLGGDPEHPVTRGFLCYRVGTHYLDRHHSPERLTTPLLREGDGFRPIAWDEALDRIARELARIRDESGAAAILHTQGGGSLGILKSLNRTFFGLLGATRTHGDVCDGAGSAAQEADFGGVDSNDITDLEHANTVVLWGKNVTASSPHTTPFLTRARKRGASTWLIDPLPHKTRALVENYVQVRPGCDGALALAIARVIVDRGLVHAEAASYCANLDDFIALVRSRPLTAWIDDAGVSRATVDALAEAYGRQGPVTTLIGWGMQRRTNGATQVRCVDALHALTGNVGIAGGSASFGVTRRNPFHLACVAEAARGVARTLPIPLLGRAILETRDPPIRAVVIDNHNPVATNPESGTTIEALRTREFVVVLDQFLTDTARCATIVLPTTTMLEEEDIIGSYGHHHVSAVRPVAGRLEGPRTDLEIYQDLARRLGLPASYQRSAREWIDEFLTKTRSHGLDYDALLARAAFDPNSRAIAWKDRRFATPSGKFHFVTAHRAAPPRDVKFPLALHGLSTGRWQGSQLTEADEEREGELEVTVHPSACAGLDDGAKAWLETEAMRLPVVLKHDASYRTDCVYAPRARAVRRQLCVNQLVTARLTDFGDGAAYYDQGVRITPR